MGLWPIWLNEVLSRKFIDAVRKEGFLTVYQRLHKAKRSNQGALGTYGPAACVGRDEFGNRYFEDRDAIHYNRRRWVEHSDYFKTIGQFGDRIPPRWHGWLTQQYDEVPSLTRED
jgi:hypothetical protein